MGDNLEGIDDDVRFDFDAADTAITDIRKAANRLESTAGVRAGAVATGSNRKRRRSIVRLGCRSAARVAECRRRSFPRVV